MPTQLTPASFIRIQVLGMSQTELAQALHVTQPAVSAWELRGTIPSHHRDAVRALAKSRGKKIKDDLWEKLPF